MQRFTPVVALLLSSSLALSQEATKDDFVEYSQAMAGHWHGNVTLSADIPGIGKKGEKKSVHSHNSISAGGKAICQDAYDEQGGTAATLIYYDVSEKRIKGATVFSGGSIDSFVVNKQDNNWISVVTSLHPNGDEASSVNTLVITDNGNTHTWNRDGTANVWRKVGNDKGWFRYFMGEWTRDTTIIIKGDGKVEELKEKIDWTGHLAAGGMACTYVGKNAEGVESSAYMRWDGYTGRITEHGNDSEGISWSIVFDKVTDSVMEGKLTGNVPEGKGEGSLTIKKTGADSYRADWTFKTESGATLTGVELNKRK